MSFPIRFGLKVSGQNSTIDAMRDCWQIADDAGFDHLWNFDHMAGVKSGGLESSIFEAWTLLAAMAEATTRVRIGCLVTGNTYRHPAVLAKTAVTVDHLSGGRLEFGIGAAHAEAEHTMYGIAGLDHRIGRLSESLQVMKLLWTKNRSDFEGNYYQLRDAIANPKPLQQPHPPIWMGGRGPATIKLIARHADVWNLTGIKDAAEAGELGKTLSEECERQGRDSATLRWSAQVFWDGVDRAPLRSDVAACLEQGFTEIVIFPDVRATGGDLVSAVEATAVELGTLRDLAA
jgi:F420-dependent oxidoreductase-like protein